jgi:hypothetical protein
MTETIRSVLPSLRYCISHQLGKSPSKSVRFSVAIMSVNGSSCEPLRGRADRGGSLQCREPVDGIAAHRQLPGDRRLRAALPMKELMNLGPGLHLMHSFLLGTSSSWSTVPVEPKGAQISTGEQCSVFTRRRQRRIETPGTAKAHPARGLDASESQSRSVLHAYHDVPAERGCQRC